MIFLWAFHLNVLCCLGFEWSHVVASSWHVDDLEPEQGMSEQVITIMEQSSKRKQR